MASFEEYLLMTMSDDSSSDEHGDEVSPPPRVGPEEAFSLSANKFKKIFRLTKPLARDLIEELRPFISSPNRASDLCVELKVLSALNFFGTGSYQTCVGNDRYAAMSQPSISRSLAEVVAAINQPDIFNKYVKFPSNNSEMNTIAQKFYQLYGLPGVVGCIDCTHVAIVPPPNNEVYDERSYVNRKGYHSINTQLICDADLYITNVNALFPGSTHDSYIWNQSAVKPVLQQIYQNQREGPYYLIGDSGYGLRPWLQVPIIEPSNVHEENYNDAFKSARATIERCNGVLKGRFRCLLKHRVLHYSPEKASKIINSCVVLHNICMKNNVDLDSEESEEEIDFGLYELTSQPEANLASDLSAGRALQASIVNNYF